MRDTPYAWKVSGPGLTRKFFYRVYAN